MFILKKGHQPGVYVPLRALFLVTLKGWHSLHDQGPQGPTRVGLEVKI